MRDTTWQEFFSGLAVAVAIAAFYWLVLLLIIG